MIWGVYKSTVFRTLTTMEARGFVKKNPETEKYWLGNRLFTLGKSVENRMGLREIVKPYVSELYDLYHEVINVSVLERNQNDIYKSVIIYKADNPNQVLKANPSVGSSSECHCSSVGKCLLAFGRDVDLSVYEAHPLSVYTEYTISTVEKLKEELQDVREKGICDRQRRTGTWTYLYRGADSGSQRTCHRGHLAEWTKKQNVGRRFLRTSQSSDRGRKKNFR